MGGWLASWAQRWQAETGAGWAVTRDGEVVGRVGFRVIDLVEGSAELGYWTVPAARGGNVAARAVVAISAWAFTELERWKKNN